MGCCGWAAAAVLALDLSPHPPSPLRHSLPVLACRYREKRKNRRFQKTIRYASRKAYAEVRGGAAGGAATRWRLFCAVRVSSSPQSCVRCQPTHAVVVLPLLPAHPHRQQPYLGKQVRPRIKGRFATREEVLEMKRQKDEGMAVPSFS